MISVIVPIHKISVELSALRKLIAKEKCAELILVIQNHALQYSDKLYPNEHFIISSEKGRGNNFVMGLDAAKGDIIVFGHADTLMPENWYNIITTTLKDDKIAGGEFHLRFNKTNVFLNGLIFLSDCMFYIKREMWGDRCMFFRADLVRQNQNLLNVPIMEDVILSKLLNKNGKVKMMKEHVITSSESFLKRGVLRHTLKIIQCRTMFALGMNLNRIYEAYYS